MMPGLTIYLNNQPIPEGRKCVNCLCIGMMHLDWPSPPSELMSPIHVPTPDTPSVLYISDDGQYNSDIFINEN